MKYGEEVVKLFQYYIDNNIRPMDENRVAIVKNKVVLGVYSTHMEAGEEADKKLERLTYMLYVFYPILPCLEKFNFPYSQSYAKLGGTES